MLEEPWAVFPYPEVRAGQEALYQGYFGDTSLSETLKFILNPCCNFSIAITA